MTVRSDRDANIVALLRERGRLSVDDLSAALDLTPATIRRDLQRLASSGLVVRTYGGALLPGAGSQPVAELHWKGRIADAAADLVRDGETIVISSGSTTLEFARRLTGRRLTVITNTLDVAFVLMDQPGIQLIVLGGQVRPTMHSLLGHLTELASKELRADTLFLGIPALSVEHGLMSSHMPEILTDRALQKMAASVIVLADATKIGRVAPAFLFGLDEVHALVTDHRAPAETITAIEELGVQVTIVGDADLSQPSRRQRPAGTNGSVDT